MWTQKTRYIYLYNCDIVNTQTQVSFKSTVNIEERVSVYHTVNTGRKLSIILTANKIEKVYLHLTVNTETKYPSNWLGMDDLWLRLWLTGTVVDWGCGWLILWSTEAVADRGCGWSRLRLIEIVAIYSVYVFQVKFTGPGTNDSTKSVHTLRKFRRWFFLD